MRRHMKNEMGSVLVVVILSQGCVNRRLDDDEAPVTRDPAAICQADCNKQAVCNPGSGDPEQDEASRRACFDECFNAREVYKLADEACWFLFLDWRACLTTLACDEYPETPGSGCEEVHTEWAEKNFECVLTHSDDADGG